MKNNKVYAIFVSSKFDYELKEMLVAICNSKSKLKKIEEQLEKILEDEFIMYDEEIEVNKITSDALSYYCKRGVEK